MGGSLRMELESDTFNEQFNCDNTFMDKAKKETLGNIKSIRHLESTPKFSSSLPFSKTSEFPLDIKYSIKCRVITRTYKALESLGFTRVPNRNKKNMSLWEEELLSDVVESFDIGDWRVRLYNFLPGIYQVYIKASSNFFYKDFQDFGEAYSVFEEVRSILEEGVS